MAPHTRANDPLYPIGENREENILVEFQGILHSEAEEVFYGLEGCGCLDMFPFKKYHDLMHTYARMLISDRAAAKQFIYKEISFFRPNELLTYLNDGQSIDAPLSEGNLHQSRRSDYALRYCRSRYNYNVATLTSMAGALIPLLTDENDIVKHMTVLLPQNWKWTMLAYLDRIYTAEVVAKKISLAYPDPGESPVDAMYSLMEKAYEEGMPYTTIITNEIDLIERCLTNYTKFGDQGQFYLLRNHSGNTDMVMSESTDADAVKFVERGNDKIEGLIMPIRNRLIDGLPLPLMVKFARFSPAPYQH